MDYGFLFELEKEFIMGQEFTRMMDDHGVLRAQREALGLTQQQVANKSNITLRQYQRFESGERSITSTSLRIGANVCSTLKINPLFFADPGCRE
jgi:transcriptional regulator with XRE-family HTH domain